MLIYLLDKVSFLHRHFPRGEIISSFCLYKLAFYPIKSKKLEKYNFDVVFVFIHAPISICIKFNETKNDSIAKGHCKAYPNF